MLTRHLTAAALALCAMTVGALACETEEMAKTEDGFIFKVVAGSDKIVAFEGADGGAEAFTLGLLQPYFVICDAGEHWRITDLPAETVDEAETGAVGFVRKDQVFTWPTREALHFGTLIWTGDRPEVVAWEDEETLAGFMESGDMRRFPPTFQEDLESTLKRPRETRPYPVLGSDTRKLRSRDKRVFQTLIPAALPPETAVVLEDEEAVEVAVASLGRTNFVIVFDATGSMEKVAPEVAADLLKSFESLEEEQRDTTQIGFVFFRDEDDEEKLVASELMPFTDAANLLNAAAGRMGGGGDDAEPILDATYFAANFFNWGGAGGQDASRKMLIGVLNGDAKPVTTGRIDERVRPGIDAITMANELREAGYSMITVQPDAGAGPELKRVLGTLAEGTDGQFIDEAAGVGESRRRVISEALTRLMAETVVAEAARGDEIAGEVFDYGGFPAIPLRVLDGEQLERMRRAGIDFNIDNREGGVLVREAYIIENEDMFEPRIQIEKETLEGLINLLSIIATVGADVEGMIEAAGEAIATIAGEDFDPEENLSEIIRKQLGIQFRTGLLSFQLDYLAGLTPDERVATTKRVQDAAATLSQFYEANLSEWETQPSVWMPVGFLP
ncbi:MAG: VWA domain-containing protein [Pseudomonadota bacterium]